jgi:hypothetical protein
VARLLHGCGGATELASRARQAPLIGEGFRSVAEAGLLRAAPGEDKSSQIEDEIRLAGEFGGRAEQLAVAKGQYPTGERSTPLMAYWSLTFEFHKAILSLVTNRYYGAAFAFVRPLVECAIRAHLVTFVPKEVLKNILDDEYRTNFGTVGKEIDDPLRHWRFLSKFFDGRKGRATRLHSRWKTPVGQALQPR